MAELSAQEIIEQITGGLEQLTQVFESSDAITDQDKAKLAGIIQEYGSLVTENLAQTPGQDGQTEQAQQGPIQEQQVIAGAQGVQPAL